MTTLPSLALALLAALVRPALSPPPMSPDEFRAGFNEESVAHGTALRLGPWKPGLLGDLTAQVTPSVAIIAHQDREHRLSALTLFMHSDGTLESVAEIVATLAVATYVVNPGLSDAEREHLFDDLGFFDERWGERGLDGISVRGRVTWRALHPAGDPLIVVMVWWDGRRADASELSF